MATDFWSFREQVSQRTKVSAEAEPSAGALTVSQLTSQIERALLDCLPASLLVRGEMSNVNHHRGSGHLYFTLKDPRACVDCVMYKSDAVRLKFVPEDGLEVLASGRIGVYQPKGKYQLYVTRLEPLGRGALELAFRRLCAKLEAEGLFAAERKRPLPPYPQRLVLVTSTQTAALPDMLKVLRRYPWVRVMVYHVPVQGKGSAEKIAAAIADLNRGAAEVGGVDLMLLGRGGGSLEDLWEFNEEVVARAMAASRIPIITGIGHEIDVAVADLVADYHAHTPTEAAQVAMNQWRGAREAVEAAGVRLRRELGLRLQEARQRLGHIERHGVFRRPLDRINLARQVLDDRQRALALVMGTRLRRWQGLLHAVTLRLDQHRPSAILMRLRRRVAEDQRRLLGAANLRVRLSQERLGKLTAGLRERHPRHRLQLERQKLAGFSQRLERALAQGQQRRQREVEALAAQLQALNPEQVLKRGYSITTLKKGGTVVRSAVQVREGDRLVTRLGDGAIQSTVEDARQLSLFD